MINTNKNGSNEDKMIRSSLRWIIGLLLFTNLVFSGCTSISNNSGNKTNTFAVGITLTDGQNFRGRLVGKKGTTLFFETNNNPKNLISIDRDQINSIYSIKGIQNNLTFLFLNDDWMIAKYNENDFNSLITKMEMHDIKEFIVLDHPPLRESENNNKPKDCLKDIQNKTNFKLEQENNQPLNIWIVSKGESLWKIAGNQDIYGDSNKWELIWRANLEIIKDPNLIYPNQILIIPRVCSNENK